MRRREVEALEKRVAALEDTLQKSLDAQERTLAVVENLTAQADKTTYAVGFRTGG